jgi:thiamine pyrophosphokinase
MKALILVNGELYRPDVLRSRIGKEVFDLVLGVDGGSRYANTLNVTLDAVIGDLDSLTTQEQKSSSNAKFVFYPPVKDETDLELALLYAKEQGAGEIIMVGAMGGRIDMTIANILLMAHANFSTCRIEFWHGEQTGRLIKPPGEVISGQPGDTVSLIPLGGDASGITTQGLKYALNDAVLTFGSSRGVSNLMTAQSARVRLLHGQLLAIHAPPAINER